MSTEIDSAARPAPDFAQLTEAGRRVWSSGDFNAIARQTMPMAEDLVRAADPHPGQAVLDVACGSGNAALVAARRYCAVAGIDIAENLIERARARAAADGVEVDFRVGDAQALPYADGRFDAVMSVFGAMFAPDQARAATELLRVCRPGGTIAMANWMPSEFGADFFGAHARHAPPPAGAPSPLAWGSAAGIDALLGPGCRAIACERRVERAYYRSVGHAVELFSRWFGPTIRALGIVGEEGRDAFQRDIAAVFEKHNRASDGTAIVETAYLRVLAVRA
jgi:SAM-dependent methyltransferase